MKQALRFQSEQEFQSFFSQLSSAEIPDFQAVEGSGGDKGFDGISGVIAYQAYFPEEKNRTDANFIAKIDEDIEKVLTARKELGLEITEWIFIVPEDLRIKVVAHLIKKSKEKDLFCHYWGATKLTELTSKHPHIIESFPLIFMPSVKEDIREVKTLIKQKEVSVSLEDIEIIGDEELMREREAIEREYQYKIAAIPKRSDGSLFHPTREDLDMLAEKQRKVDDLTNKKMKSNRAYELAVEEINHLYDKQIEQTGEDFNRRGMYHSGLRMRAEGEIEIQRNREIEKLKLKYGISEFNLLNLNKPKKSETT